MHHIIYGIIVGIAGAAIIIVKLGNLIQPGDHRAWQQDNVHSHEYDNLEELG